MFKPAAVAVLLAVAVYACSQKEEAAPNQTQSSPTAPVNSSNTAPSSSQAMERSRSSSAPKTASSQNSGQAAADGSDHQTASQAQRGASGSPADSASSASRAKQRSNKTSTKAAANKKTPSGPATLWSEFRALMIRCETFTRDKRDQCLDAAKAAYRAADLKCETLPDGDSKECMKYLGRSNGGANKQAITHTETPAITPAAPGDPTPAQRNRDSTIQQQDAAGELSESTHEDR